MEQNILNDILEKHAKWLSGAKDGERADMSYADMSYADMSGANMRGADMSGANMSGASMSRADMSYANMSGADMRGANMSGANMSGANMSGANMSGADMRGANMSGANIDYSAWPLWCGSLKAHVDDRIAIQLLYHTLSVVQHSPYVSEDVKRALLTDTVVSVANRFHHVDECGKLAVY